MQFEVCNYSRKVLLSDKFLFTMVSLNDLVTWNWLSEQQKKLQIEQIVHQPNLSISYPVTMCLGT